MEICKKRGISPEEIDCLIVATVTPDMFFPATANIVCDKTGAKNAWGFDMSAACSGFLYALDQRRHVYRKRPLQKSDRDRRR